MTKDGGDTYVCEILPADIVLFALSELGLDAGEARAVFSWVVLRGGLAVLEVERYADGRARLALSDLFL